MGKTQSGILGPFTGSVGPVVGTTWKGITVIKSKPPERRKSTEGQLRQMAKLKLMTPFVKPLTSLLNMTYACVTFQMSCFNKALSYNMRNAISGEYPDFAINYPRVVLGVGDLMNPEITSIYSTSTGQLTLDWKDNSGEGSAKDTDRAFFAVFDEIRDRWKTFAPDQKRKTGSCTLELTLFSGHAVHVYIGFLSADAQFVSTSLYAGKVHIL